MRRLSTVCTLLATALLAASASGADQEKKPAPKKADVFTNAADAGPDFQVQGEYEGDVPGAGKYGAQVFALGAGKFDIYLLKGGLPGAGWDTKSRLKIPYRTDPNVTVVVPDWNFCVAGSSIKGTGPGGKEYVLKHVDRKSQTLGAKAPAGAVVLFDGTNADEWKGGKLVEDNLLFCGTTSKKGFATGKLHVEFRTPFQPKARGQGRGNSGVYILGKEIQVLDSFALKGDKGECGAFYGSASPTVNMCLPPLSWQTYDVEIHPSGDKLLATVLHNGVKIHENYPIAGASAKPADIHLQNHGNPVVYRNIWFVPTNEAPSKTVTPVKTAKEEGFVPMFDGKTFDGWKVSASTPKSWKIEEGLLVLTGGGSHLWTEKPYQDFVVRFEWRPEKKGYNSGFFIRGGNQIQMLQSDCGHLLTNAKETKGVPNLHKAPGEWNEWEVTCVGPKVSLKVNGTQAWEIDTFKPTKGPIGIEAEGHHIDFRNLRIREIKKSEP